MTSIITKNKDLVNNLAMQKLINQAIIRALASYNIQFNKLFSSINLLNLIDFAS